MARDKYTMVEVKRKSLKRVIDYPYDEEEKNWIETGRARGYIFTTIKQLRFLVDWIP